MRHHRRTSGRRRERTAPGARHARGLENATGTVRADDQARAARHARTARGCVISVPARDREVTGERHAPRTCGLPSESPSEGRSTVECCGLRRRAFRNVALARPRFQSCRLCLPCFSGKSQCVVARVLTFGSDVGRSGYNRTDLVHRPDTGRDSAWGQPFGQRLAERAVRHQPHGQRDDAASWRPGPSCHGDLRADCHLQRPRRPRVRHVGNGLLPHGSAVRELVACRIRRRPAVRVLTLLCGRGLRPPHLHVRRGAAAGRTGCSPFRADWLSTLAPRRARDRSMLRTAVLHIDRDVRLHGRACSDCPLHRSAAGAASPRR